MKLPQNGVVIAVLVIAFVVVWAIVQKSADQIIATEREGREVWPEGERPLDAIIVLMGGQTEDGLPLWVSRRLDLAVKLQRERRTSKGGELPPIVSVGAGTDSKPPYWTEEGFWWYESNSAAEYLNKTHHVDFKLLQKECTSLDTIGNGYFSLVQFAMPTGWRHIAIITSEFHMARSEAIFEWTFGLPGAGASLEYRPAKDQLLQGSKAQGFALEYHSASDQGLPAVPLQNRQRIEVKELKYVKELALRIRTLPQLHEYIYLERSLYNTANVSEFGKPRANPIDALY